MYIIVKLNCAFINVHYKLNQDIEVCFIQEFHITFEAKLNSKGACRDLHYKYQSVLNSPEAVVKDIFKWMIPIGWWVQLSTNELIKLLLHASHCDHTNLFLFFHSKIKTHKTTLLLRHKITIKHRNWTS